MNRTDAPAKQAKPFGINGQREPLLPTTPAGDNTASYELGFPPITMILKSAGGLPPKGQDMNQILFELSSLTRWFSAGALNTFDSSFSGVIGGYPAGSLLWSNDGTKIFVNTVNDNTGDPNTGASGWVELLTYIGIKDASTTQKGIVALTSSRVSGSETIAATANAVAQNYNDIIALQGKTNDATSTNKGIVKLSDNRNDQSSAASLIASSQKAASDNYYDIKTTFGQIGEKGRLIGVTYTNSQAMTIYVYVSGIASEGSVFLSATVNGVNMTGAQSTNIAGQRICIGFMVPSGGTYQVGISGGTLSSQAWVETDKK